MSFFVAKNEAPNIENSTIAALASVVEQSANALVHLDEFKNDIDLRKREFLKGLWDGTGRTKMNMDNDKKKETTQVDSGVIVSGQEMATADVALFSRMLFLEFNNCEFSKQQQLRFDKLKEIRQKGCTHITLSTDSSPQLLYLLKAAVYTTAGEYNLITQVIKKLSAI